MKSLLLVLFCIGLVMWFSGWLAHVFMMTEIKNTRWRTYMYVGNKLNEIDWLCCHDFKGSLYFDKNNVNKVHANQFIFNEVGVRLDPISWLVFNIHAMYIYINSEKLSWGDMWSIMYSR